MPKWLKIVLGVVVVGIVLGVLSIGGCVMFVLNASKQAQDPAYISKVLSEIVTIEKPPADFHYVVGMDVGMLNFKCVIANYPPTNLYLMLAKVPSEDKPPEQLAASLSEKGVKGGSQFEVKSKGTEQVAGQTFNYVIGSTTKDGKTLPSMAGIIPTTNKKDMIFIFGTHQNLVPGSEEKSAPDDKSTVPTEYDWTHTQELLKSITAIPN